MGPKTALGQQAAGATQVRRLALQVLQGKAGDAGARVFQQRLAGAGQGLEALAPHQRNGGHLAQFLVIVGQQRRHRLRRRRRPAMLQSEKRDGAAGEIGHREVLAEPGRGGGTEALELSRGGLDLAPRQKIVDDGVDVAVEGLGIGHGCQGGCCASPNQRPQAGISHPG